jgi:hypothetical protein
VEEAIAKATEQLKEIYPDKRVEVWHPAKYPDFNYVGALAEGQEPTVPHDYQKEYWIRLGARIPHYKVWVISKDEVMKLWGFQPLKKK